MLEEYGVGLWNITDVLEFPSTLMEQRTLDARGVLSIYYYYKLPYIDHNCLGGGQR